MYVLLPISELVLRSIQPKWAKVDELTLEGESWSCKKKFLTKSVSTKTLPCSSQLIISEQWERTKKNKNERVSNRLKTYLYSFALPSL